MENKGKKSTLTERVKRLEALVDRLQREVFTSSSTNLQTGETRIHLKGRVDELEDI